MVEGPNKEPREVAAGVGVTASTASKEYSMNGALSTVEEMHSLGALYFSVETAASCECCHATT